MSTFACKLGIGVGVFVLLTYGIYLRMYPLSTQPFLMEEGSTINAVHSYGAGKMTGLSATLDSGQSYNCFLYCYPTALITQNWGATAVSYRLVAVFFGMLAVLAVFTTAYLLYSLPVALLAGFLTLFSYYQLAWSTHATIYTLLAGLTWSTLAAAASTYRLSPISRSYHVFALLCISLSLAAVLIHPLCALIPLLSAAVLLSPYLKGDVRPTRPTQAYAALLIIIGGFGVYGFVHSGVFNFFSSSNVYPTAANYLGFIWREYWVLLPFAFFALASKGKKAQFLLLVFLSYILALSLFTTVVHFRYLLHVIPALFILASVGVFELAKLLPGTIYIKHSLAILTFLGIFLWSGTGSFMPVSHYVLESAPGVYTTGADNLSHSLPYTPQPDWNAAYTFIKQAGIQGDSIISSHPQFNSIFLTQPGYFLPYTYTDFDSHSNFRSEDGREFFVGASVIDDIDQLKSLISTTHGFIVFDYFAQDNRIDIKLLDYIEQNTHLVYFDERNPYSKIWIFQF